MNKCENNKEILEIVNDLIDNEARALVGILCKRVEVLEDSKSLNAKLYKNLAKENIYEFTRHLKKLIKLSLELKVKFKIKPKKTQ